MLKLPKVVTKKKRIGRGIGSSGAKSGRGQKGQKARAGYSRKIGHEGGQTPLYMRLPKGRGTKQKYPSQKKAVFNLHVSDLDKFANGDIVGPGVLHKRGWLAYGSQSTKLIGSDKVAKKVTVRVHGASPNAIKAVETAGGKVEIIG